MLTLTGKRGIVLVIASVLHIFGYLWFLKGFFPAKINLAGVQEFPIEGSPFSFKGAAQFDNLVLIVIDAMRSDFMFDKAVSHMPFVHQLIETGDALPFTAHASPPTVTLPRLKGITTGSSPSFLDAILNIADDNDNSQGMSEYDSWLSQMKKQGKSMRFYGDDTWLKLFPPEHYFERFEGTNSFFVSDFTEVDNNVTRHLDLELDNIKKNDVLILHYLGLDHIGHKGGPQSPYMANKQREMDQIIRRVYESASKKNSLIVVMGDHGMNEIGNHGGSSAGETSPGMILASPKFRNLRRISNMDNPKTEGQNYQYYKRISQVDLVPTLATLFNFPIPKNSIGVIIDDILGLWDTGQRKLILENNLKCLSSLKSGYHTSTDTKNSEAEIHRELRELQSTLQSAATDYKYAEIKNGLILMTVGAFFSLALLVSYCHSNLTEITTHYLVIGLYSVHFHASSLVEEEHQIWWLINITLLLLYCYTRRLKNISTCALILLGLRSLRAWNNSGQKHNTALTFGDVLLSNTTLLWSLVTITYSVLAIKIFSQGNLIDCLTLTKLDNMTEKVKDFGTLASFIMIFVTCSISLLFKLCQWVTDGHVPPPFGVMLLKWLCESYGIDYESTDKHNLQEINTHLTRITGWLILGLLIVRLILGKIRGLKSNTWTDVTNILTIGLLHQTRVEVIPIFLVFFLMKYVFASQIKKEEDQKIDLQKRVYLVTITSICAQQLSFFSMGGTNLLATVDLSNAYNGIKSYNVIIVGLLTFISNFSGPIFWVMSSYQLIFDAESTRYERASQPLVREFTLKKQVLLFKAIVSLLFYSVSALSLAGSCFNLRFHLFIWSVFSPKLLFFGVWTLFINVIVELLMTMLSLYI